MRYIAAFLLCSVTVAFAHDSWISKGGFRSPPSASTPGEWCCGDGDCGLMTGGTIVGREDGYHVDADFTVFGSEPIGNVTEHFHEIVPYTESQPSPDGAFWRCKRPNGSLRCFFAPPPNT